MDGSESVYPLERAGSSKTRTQAYLFPVKSRFPRRKTRIDKKIPSLEGDSGCHGTQSPCTVGCTHSPCEVFRVIVPVAKEWFAIGRKTPGGDGRRKRDDRFFRQGDVAQPDGILPGYVRIEDEWSEFPEEARRSFCGAILAENANGRGDPG